MYSTEELPFEKIQSIVVAEDLLINLEVFKRQITEVGLIDRCSFCTNGQETIDVAKKIVEAAVAFALEPTIRPITVMILDFQMPLKNG